MIKVLARRDAVGEGGIACGKVEQWEHTPPWLESERSEPPDKAMKRQKA